MFELEIKFDGRDEKNITAMLFFIMFGLGLRVQGAWHDDSSMNSDLEQACQGVKMYKERAIAEMFKR